MAQPNTPHGSTLNGYPTNTIQTYILYAQSFWYSVKALKGAKPTYNWSLADSDVDLLDIEQIHYNAIYQ